MNTNLSEYIMSKHINRLLLIVCLLSGLKYNAQQNSLFNTYVYDPFQLNIAYIGHSCTEADLHYRTQWIGMKEAPSMFQLNAHTALGKSNGLGIRFLSQQIGLLNNTQATLGYAYRFKASATADVHLGLGIGWTQSALNAPRATVIDANDVTLAAGRQRANGFDSEFGAMYLGRKFKAGIAVQHLYNSNPSYAASNYKLMPQSNVNISYIFNKDGKVEIEPWLVDRYTLNGTHTLEGLLNVSFAKMVTVGAGYRSNYGLLGFLGVKVGNLKIAYSFDYGTSKYATANGSSHQVLLGFSFCRSPKAAPEKAEEPVAVANATVAAEPEKTVKEEEPVQEVKEVKEVTEVKQEEPVKQVAVEEKKEEVKASVADDNKVLEKMNELATEVIFDLESSELDAAGLSKLDEIADALKKHPELKVNIIGHSCNRGTPAFNKDLSNKRALYVKQQLVKRGVAAKNIRHATGVGADNELYSNSDESTQSKNRTVRFELTK